MKKAIAKPVNPFKAIFLSATLIVGGCASRPADFTISGTVTGPGRYWKWVAERKSWLFFDATGKMVAGVSEYEDIWLIEQSCLLSPSERQYATASLWLPGGTSISVTRDTYDTPQHAQLAVERLCK